MINENDAPPGYKAVALLVEPWSPNTCKGCAFDTGPGCTVQGDYRCTSIREDKEFVIFVKK